MLSRRLWRPTSSNRGHTVAQASSAARVRRRAGGAELPVRSRAGRRCEPRCCDRYRRSSFRRRSAIRSRFRVRGGIGRMAAEASSAEGQALLAYVLTNGPRSARNRDEAHQWYERSAAGGCPQGHLGYALSLARRPKDADSLRQSRSISVGPPMRNCRRRFICWPC